MTPLPKHALQIPRFLYDMDGMIIGHDDPVIGYTEQQMLDYGQAAREACAKACENLAMQQDRDVRDQCAAAIRAMGNT